MFGTYLPVFESAHNRALALPGTAPATHSLKPDEELQIEGADAGSGTGAVERTTRGQHLSSGRFAGCLLVHAQVVTLALEELTYAEIGDVLGISETNVGARLTRAREKSRDIS